ncbi:hypothetical protein [Roseateles asaccharophilus]|uniref:hypothetical protein n=1 Tax=Roseateles asaccharophilus TaxID=582607 RepID=UPI00384E2072
MSSSKPQLLSDSLMRIEDILAADALQTHEYQHFWHAQCLGQHVLKGGSLTQISNGIARCKGFIERGIPAYDPLSQMQTIGKRQVLTDLVGAKWDPEAAEDIGGLMDLYFAKGYINVEWSAAGFTPNGNSVRNCALEHVVERGFLAQLTCLLRNGADPLIYLSNRKGSIHVRDLIVQQTHPLKDEMLAQATEILMRREINASVGPVLGGATSPPSTAITSRRRQGI